MITPWTSEETKEMQTRAVFVNSSDRDQKQIFRFLYISDSIWLVFLFSLYTVSERNLTEHIQRYVLHVTKKKITPVMNEIWNNLFLPTNVNF